jgi:hypothetical protein
MWHGLLYGGLMDGWKDGMLDRRVTGLMDKLISGQKLDEWVCRLVDRRRKN